MILKCISTYIATVKLQLYARDFSYANFESSIRSHKFVSHYVSPTPYPLQATCMCKCALQMFIPSSTFRTSMFFDISNRGAGDGFASLFLIYILLANSQRNKPLRYHHDAVSKCSRSMWDTTSKMAERAYGLHSNAWQTKSHKYKFVERPYFLTSH